MGAGRVDQPAELTETMMAKLTCWHAKRVCGIEINT